MPTTEEKLVKAALSQIDSEASPKQGKKPQKQSKRIVDLKHIERDLLTQYLGSTQTSKFIVRTQQKNHKFTCNEQLNDS